MSTITQHIASVRATIPDGVTLVCVSKFHPAEAIMEAYEAGERDFGESRVQELLPKYKALPKDIRWHFIGHLQTNKVKQIVPFVYMIHSVDSVRLLETINKEAEKIGRRIKVLLEVHVAKEETKSGFTPDELLTFNSQLSYSEADRSSECEIRTFNAQLSYSEADRSSECEIRTLNSQHSTFNAQLSYSEADRSSECEIRTFNNIEICGLMGMATNTDDEAEWRRCFREIKSLSSHLITSSPIAYSAASDSSPSERPTISMGMSDDYLVAIEEGSTMVRIGSTIFGTRTSKH